MGPDVDGGRGVGDRSEDEQGVTNRDPWLRPVETPGLEQGEDSGDAE